MVALIAILYEEWARCGHDPLQKHTLRDKIVPITVGLGAIVFTIGLDIALAAAFYYQVTPDQYDWAPVLSCERHRVLSGLSNSLST